MIKTQAKSSQSINAKSAAAKKESKAVAQDTNTEKKPRFYESWTFLILFCVVLPMLIRSFLYTPFHIPSGSMKSGLLVGDYIFVSKYAYGYSKYSLPFSPDIFEGRKWFTPPKRGDVVVFRLPTNTSIDYIKRVIGLPGDKIQVQQGVLYINGKAVPRKKTGTFVDNEQGQETTLDTYTETLPNGVSYTVLDQTPYGMLDNTQIYTVPEHHYFMMGDNRDNSQDSRVQEIVGYVPEENLIGQAKMVLMSVDSPFWQFWRWPFTLRSGRFFTLIH
ncbi:MAG: signal peptidase I [Proteobacteria bacterium]|nr:signal peptidase I [Pseudomonadota bacterium]